MPQLARERWLTPETPPPSQPRVSNRSLPCYQGTFRSDRPWSVSVNEFYVLTPSNKAPLLVPCCNWIGTRHVVGLQR